MIKIKHILVTGVLSVLMYSCGKDSSSKEKFDYEAQSIKDNELIVKFLKKHYFDEKEGALKPLADGKTAIFNETEKLKKQEVKEDDVNYTLYYYVEREGVSSKGNPTIVDSVFVKYNGVRILDEDKLSESFDKQEAPMWFTLSQVLKNGKIDGGVIKGWSYGFTHFKGGKNVTKNSSITYEDGGKGILFIPSGLAYKNSRTSSIPENSCLVFYIDLWDHTENTDGDNDNIPSIKEDLNRDKNLLNDDTDKDKVPNFLDTDDDGDGKLTKDEDANGDGDPTNDFSDPKKPTVPDYLNRDIY
ncbi:MAG: FKBP-type peptidyl-prolyl cis-trans isomerase [Tenacibaculum sp.]|nr:FKBP-type peptidyl-prolyl cis-trans isomerase [Tenacibaculum sp.]